MTASIAVVSALVVGAIIALFIGASPLGYLVAAAAAGAIAFMLKR